MRCVWCCWSANGNDGSDALRAPCSCRNSLNRRRHPQRIKVPSPVEILVEMVYSVYGHGKPSSNRRAVERTRTRILPSYHRFFSSGRLSGGLEGLVSLALSLGPL